KDIQVKQSSVTGLPRLEVKHKWGKTNIYIPPDSQVARSPRLTQLTSPTLTIVHVQIPTVASRYDAKLKEVVRDKDNITAESWLNLAEWSLQHGLVDKVAKHSADAEKADPKNPIVLACKRVEAAMNRSVADADALKALQDRLGSYKVKSSKHYTLLYDCREDALADSRLKRLEDTYHNFYYWFALKGKELQVPGKRLLAVLVDEPEPSDTLHKRVYDEAPPTTEGFSPRGENGAFFCAKRLDEPYQGLTQATKSLWSTFSRKQLLEGKGWNQAS